MNNRQLPFYRFTFRLAAMYMLLFFVSFLILFSFLFYYSQREQQQQLETQIRTDAQAFADRYALFGINGVIRLISNRVQSASGNQTALYVLRGPQGQILAGTIDRWPEPPKGSPSKYIIAKPLGSDRKNQYLVKTLSLPLAGDLLIGKSTEALNQAKTRLIQIFSLGIVITLALGLVGGILLSKRAVRRIERINRLCRNIIDGDFSSRIDANPDGDDLDQLSSNINEMLDRIERLMRDITQVSDNVAHDLRTPLSHLRNRLETATSLIKPNSAANVEVEGAIEDADSLLETFNALLRIAKIESGQKKARFETIDISNIVDDVIEMYEPLAEEKKQSLLAQAGDSNGKHSSKSPLFVKGDKNLVFQALANLVDNAIKHGPVGGHIHITEMNEANQIIISICDNGSGIEENQLDSVTKRFYRLEQSRSTPGNGLGLSLVKAIAELHQGKVVLKNNSPGLCASISLKK